MRQIYWHRTTTHHRKCFQCGRASDNARTEAIVNGSNTATYTYTHKGIEHTATVTKPKKRMEG